MASELSRDQSDAVRIAVGRLESGSRELATIALVMPIFLAGAELAAEGFNASGISLFGNTLFLRDGIQRPLDRATFVVFAIFVLLFAARARWDAKRASRLLPEALASDPVVRVQARDRLLRLAGPRLFRRVADLIAAHWARLLSALVALVVLANLLRMPNPVWLAIALAAIVAIDVRWRGMIADAADQLPVNPVAGNGAAG